MTRIGTRVRVCACMCVHACVHVHMRVRAQRARRCTAAGPGSPAGQVSVVLKLEGVAPLSFRSEALGCYDC